jgi:hypothetical protein
MYIYKSNLSNKGFLKEKSEYALRYLDELEKEYNTVKDKPLTELSFSSFMSYAKTGERLTYENEYFARRRALRDYALITWCSGDETAAKQLENVMWAVCNEFTWCLPAHLGEDIFTETIDLFSAETAQTMAEIISLLYEKLSDEIIKRCKSEINRRVLLPFVNRKKPYGWERAQSNWSAVCGGCVGMTALYLTEDDNAAKAITNDLKKPFECYLSSFADDGTCYEGLYYWNYGMMYFTAFLDLYRQRMGERFETDDEKLCRIADFACKCCMGGGLTVSFSDAGEKDRIYSGLICRLNEMFGAHIPQTEYLAAFSGDECGRWCKAVRDIAWTKTIEKITDMRRNDVCADAQWAILRGENMSVAIKGGSNGEPHNHNDLGSIVVTKNGKTVLCDLGAGEYTADYFSEKRYGILCNSSRGHSVPIINEEEQKNGAEFSTDNFAYNEKTASMNIGGAYGISNLKSCMRTVSCDNNITVIKDEYLLCKPNDDALEVCERFVTRNTVTEKDGEIKIISDGQCIAVIEPQSENEFDVEFTEYIHREHDGTETVVTAIDFKFTVKDKCCFLVKVH